MAEKKKGHKDGIRSVWTIGNTIKVSFTVDGVDCFLEIGLLELKRLLKHEHHTRPEASLNCPTGRCSA